MSSSNPNHDANAGESLKFVPAIDPHELASDPAGPSLDQYAADWLPGQSEHMNNVIRAMSHPTGQPKAESHADALAEQRREGIKYFGFETDPDFANLGAQLESVFGKELLDACLIDHISYYPGTVALDVEGKFYAVPVEDYARVKPALPDPGKNRFRAFSNFNLNHHRNMKQWQRLPIIVYSFEGESMDDKPFLPEGLDEAEKLRLYKVGTVVHEVAHAVYDNVFSDEDRAQWEGISNASAALTQYVGNFEGKPGRENEQFAEAVRLGSTNPDSLHEQSSEIPGFIRARLPQLRIIT